MDAYPQSQGADMHHKNLNILIQRRFSKFILINDFDSANSWKSFFGSVDSLTELFLSKLDVSITQSKDGHA